MSFKIRKNYDTPLKTPALVEQKTEEEETVFLVDENTGEISESRSQKSTVTQNATTHTTHTTHTSRETSVKGFAMRRVAECSFM
jgi:BRCT domain type II-containing protein